MFGRAFAPSERGEEAKLFYGYLQCARCSRDAWDIMNSRGVVRKAISETAWPSGDEVGGIFGTFRSLFGSESVHVADDRGQVRDNLDARQPLFFYLPALGTVACEGCVGIYLMGPSKKTKRKRKKSRKREEKKGKGKKGAASGNGEAEKGKVKKAISLDATVERQGQGQGEGEEEAKGGAAEADGGGSAETKGEGNGSGRGDATSKGEDHGRGGATEGGAAAAASSHMDTLENVTERELIVLPAQAPPFVRRDRSWMVRYREELEQEEKRIEEIAQSKETAEPEPSVLETCLIS